jgi:hypothetical protein
MRRFARSGALAALGGASAVMIGGAALGLPPSDTGTSTLFSLLVTAPGLVIVGVVTAIETEAVFEAEASWGVETADAATVAAVTLGAATTRLAAVELALGAVVAAAAVGLLAAWLTPGYAAPVYCGAFVGMASPALFANPLAVTVAGVVAGVVFVAADGVFTGYGGKLGTTAFVGCSAVAVPLAASGGTGTVVAPPTAAGFVPAGVVGAVATFVVSGRLDRGTVEASALVGLAGGLLCPLLFGAGEALAAVVFCASFAGMVHPRRLPTAWLVALAGACCGLLVAATGTVFVGAGGKLGTIAFTACLLVRGLRLAGQALPGWLPVAARAES